jgi:hypothetical protein
LFSGGLITTDSPFYYIHPNFGFSFKLGNNPLFGVPRTNYSQFGITHRGTISFGIESENSSLVLRTSNHDLFVQSGSTSSNRNINLTVNGTGRVRFSLNNGGSYTNAQNGPGTI